MVDAVGVAGEAGGEPGGVGGEHRHEAAGGLQSGACGTSVIVYSAVCFGPRALQKTVATADGRSSAGDFVNHHADQSRGSANH